VHLLTEPATPSVAVMARVLISRQPGVVDSSVWYAKGGTLLARVVVSEESNLTAKDVQQMCLQRLGESGTPRMVLMERVLRAAA